MKPSRQSLFESIKSAFLGLHHVYKERNFTIQFIVGVVVITAALFLPLDGIERALVILAVMLVLAAETINTAIEHLLDHVTPKHNSDVARIKELMAAAVLLMVMASLAIGVPIFVRALFYAGTI